MGEYEIVALQEDLKNVKTDHEWCERFQEFMNSKHRKYLRLDPVLDSALIEGNDFAEHVKDCVRSPHWYVRDEDEEKEILVQDLPTTFNSGQNVVVGKSPSTAIGTKASLYFNTVISALKIHMSSRKVSTVAYVLLLHTLSLKQPAPNRATEISIRKPSSLNFSRMKILPSRLSMQFFTSAKVRTVTRRCTLHCPYVVFERGCSRISITSPSIISLPRLSLKSQK